jgi:steroid delta-isomerase-like uncharacterized protein
MSTKDLKALMHRFVEEWNKGKAAAMKIIDEGCATNIVYNSSSGEDILHGLKDYKQFFGEFFDAFPDQHITLEDIVAEGDKVVTRYSLTGTHKGKYGGIPATNKKVTMSVIEIDRVAGGKIIEEWVRFDTLGFMQQLGVVPAPKK